MSKQRPRLHLVTGSKDPELFNEDLDWYWGTFDSACGLKSCDAESIYLATGTNEDCGVRPKSTNSGYPATDDNFLAHLGSFRRARRIWQQLTQLPWGTQCKLREYYEPRQYRDPDLPMTPETEIRAAHRSYIAMDKFRHLEARTKTLAKEDSINRRTAAAAEPLVAELHTGNNWFESADYSVIARYLLDSQKAEEAIDRGEFRVDGIVVIRWDGVGRERLVTVAELSRMTGTDDSTLQRQVEKLNLPRIVRGRKKLYSLTQLRAALLNFGE